MGLQHFFYNNFDKIINWRIFAIAHYFKTTKGNFYEKG